MKTKMIMRSGTLFTLVTWYRQLDPGKAPSLAIANPILVVTVMLLKPAKKRLMRTIIAIARAPPFLYEVTFPKPSYFVKACWKMLTTG